MGAIMNGAWERACDFCGATASAIPEAPPGQIDFTTVRCRGCSLDYVLVGAAEVQIRSVHKKHRLAGFVFDRNRVGELPRIREEVFRQVADLRELSLQEKAGRLLAELGRVPLAEMHTEQELREPRFAYAIHGESVAEVVAVARTLEADGLFQFTQEFGTTSGALSPQGFRQAQCLRCDG
jgi:hypothetical protein